MDPSDAFTTRSGDRGRGLKLGEFWYSNVPTEYVDTLAVWNTSLPGNGSYREVMVYIDDIPVGVVWPFEVIFTGRFCPGFWRPIVGHRTFNLPSYSIDMKPAIPYLQNGFHNIKFGVLGQPTTPENWYVSGQLHLWYLNASNSSAPANRSLSSISPVAEITTTGYVAPDNSSFSVTTTARRRDEKYAVNYTNHQRYKVLLNGTSVLQSLIEIVDFELPNGSMFLNATVHQYFIDLC